MKKFLTLVLLMLSLDAFAGANISSVTLVPDALSPLEQYTIDVQVNGNGSHWDSTRITIGGVPTCLSEWDKETKNRSYTFSAPSDVGVYPVSVRVYDNGDFGCFSNSYTEQIVNLTVQSTASSSHACAAVWPTEFTENYSGEFEFLYDLDNATNVYNYSLENRFNEPTGVYVADEFTVSSSQVSYTGTDPVTIYANTVLIQQSNINQDSSNPLIIIAKNVTIIGSQVNAAIYITDPSSSITGSSITGALTSPADLNFTYDNNAGPDNNIYFDEYYFDNANIGGECSGSGSSTDHTFLDRFSLNAYTNNDGLEDFVQEWREDGDDDSANSGDIRITNGRLRLQDDDVSIRREVNLSSYSTATLSFDYEMITSYIDDDVYLQIRTGNGNWTTLKTFEGEVDEGEGSYSIDISGYLEFDVDIRFLTASGFDQADDFYIDNFAIDVDSLALVCPVTSGYTDIYVDDFSSDSGVWQLTDFTRNVSVWPGESIENDIYENQNIDYQVTGGALVLEGSYGGNSDGNNEYGAILHDLSTERYEPDQITEYSIEVDMYPGSSSYYNNDAGVVFGYQNDNNYYVIKWTKYGTVFENDTDYPGEYQSLDLVKVENGNASLLATKRSFTGTNPMRVKVTVNADGIQICIDGDGTLLAANEQPPMYKYGFFSYENEDGVSFDNLVVKCASCQQTPLCPSTSAYDLIFDDNFDTTPNNNWQAVTLDRNNVNVWPGESIYSNNEERSIMYNVANGQLNIAGSVSSQADNEFGVVIHDVVSEGYDDSLINTYSINTDFTSHSDQSNNNDAGLVFGYQDNSNFYLLKWTKYAQNYASNTTFPGTHRSLEVLKIENGVPTLLGEEENFFANDAMELKVTVNDDGISVCVNGDNLIQVSNERPSLGQIGFFSYDNDYGVSFDDFQVWCESCVTGSGVDHYRIIHPTTGLTCSTYDVSIAACEDASCSSYSTVDVTGNLNKIASSSTTTLMNINTNTGTQSTVFGHDVAQTISFDLINQDPMPNSPNICVKDSVTGSTTTCEMVFSDSGFIVTVNDFESAIGWQQVDIQAVKDDGSQTCAPAFIGDRSVDIDFSYASPTIAEGAIAKTLGFSTTGVDVGSSDLVSGVGITSLLNFSATDATTSFYINYLDAGQLQLSVADTNGVLLADTDSFVVYPSELYIQMNDGSNLLGATGNETHFASEPFNLIIRGHNALGDTTENYRPGDLQLSPYMITPLISAGANPTTFNYEGTQTLAVTNETINWQAVDLTFDALGYEFSSAKFNEVGSFELDAFDDNYFGYDINATAVSAGRFTPYYFSVSTETQGAIMATGNGYSYIGETMPYMTDPIIRLAAQSFANAPTLNYQGFTSNFAERSYAEEVDTNFNGGNLLAGAVAASENTEFDGEFLFTLSGDTFTYLKTSTPVAPFTSQILLQLSADDLMDSDGVGYCSGDNPSDCPLTYEGYDMPLTASIEMRYGRLILQNASGTENQDGNLFVPLVVQYWDGSNYVIQDLDSTTSFDAFNGILTDVTVDPVETVIGFTLGNTGTTVVAGEPLQGEGIYVEPQSGSEYLLQIDNVPDWLNVDWDGDGDIDSDDMVSSSVIFGRFKGNDRIIYKRER